MIVLIIFTANRLWAGQCGRTCCRWCRTPGCCVPRHQPHSCKGSEI